MTKQGLLAFLDLVIAQKQSHLLYTFSSQNCPSPPPDAGPQSATLESWHLCLRNCMFMWACLCKGKDVRGSKGKKFQKQSWRSCRTLSGQIEETAKMATRIQARVCGSTHSRRWGWWFSWSGCWGKCSEPGMRSGPCACVGPWWWWTVDLCTPGSCCRTRRTDSGD